MKISQSARIKAIILCMALMMLSPVTPARESGEETTGETAEAETQDRQSNRNDTSDPPEPEPDELRRKELGEAFKQFSPSEEISADNAVPFPTDI